MVTKQQSLRVARQKAMQRAERRNHYLAVAIFIFLGVAFMFVIGMAAINADFQRSCNTATSQAYAELGCGK